MTTTTSTYPMHCADEERARLREENERLREALTAADAVIASGTLMLNAAESRWNHATRQFRAEERAHAATLEELRTVRAELAGSRRFGGILRRRYDESCSCPVGLTGERIASHECPRHGALLRWELADG